MNWIIGTQEEFEYVNLSTSGERSLEIDTPTGKQTIYIKHVETSADSLIAMARLNVYNLITMAELEWLLPVEPELIKNT
jgi:hypothetical protein